MDDIDNQGVAEEVTGAWAERGIHKPTIAQVMEPCSV
jgi:hypothetical protein